MFRNYYKTAIRSLMKSPLTSFINIFGLAVAIGVCIVVYSFLDFDYSTDRFHKNKDEVYLVTYFGDVDGTQQQYGKTPRPLAKMLSEDYSQIEKTCRIEDFNVVIKHEEHVFHEQVRFADPEFLEMFTFPLKGGLASSLADMNSIILSEDMAVKYFGEENPVGQDILMMFSENNRKTFTVTGVAAAFPDARIIDFGFLINFENAAIAKADYDFYDWKSFVNATLIQVKNPADLSHIEQGMEKYKSIFNQAQNDRTISSFAFEQLADLHLNSGGIIEGISHDYNYEGRLMMPIIALFMLLLACLNYINIAIVSSAKRLKEIGVRKVTGAGRGMVITQFLAENIFVTFFALVLGLFLAATIFLPWLIHLSGQNLDLSLFDINFWIFLISLLLFTGIASGIYPALYISRFKVVNIFKGSVQFGRKNPLTKTLLGFQLILACITITGGVMFAQNATFQKNRDWGYNPQATLYANIPDRSAYEQLHAAMAQNPNVLSLSGSAHHLGVEAASAVVHLPDRQYEVQQMAVDANYFKTMELNLSAGRVFKEHHESDKQAVVVNELLVKNLGLKQPVGQVFKIDSTRYEVIGVVKDFHHLSFYDKIKPLIFSVADKEEYRYLSLKIRSGSKDETYAALQEQWAAILPETPFKGGHQEDVWSWFFQDVDRAETFMRAVALIAILLAGMGLYGLVTLNVAGRIREFSIRKVLGAEVKNIATTIMKQYVILSAVALILGAVVSYIAIEAFLGLMYAYPIPMSFSGVVVSVVFLIIVLLAVVSVQVRRVAKSNPLKGIKVD